MKLKMKQNGLEKEWAKFSKADEQASVKPSKWKRWSEARRKKHRERMWGHVQEAGAGQVKVQVGTGIGTTQEVWETPEGGMERTERCARIQVESRGQHSYRNNFQELGKEALRAATRPEDGHSGWASQSLGNLCTVGGGCCKWEVRLDAADRSKPRRASQSQGQYKARQWAERGWGADVRQPKPGPRSATAS